MLFVLARFLSNESKSRDTNEIDTSEDKSEKSSEENSKDTSKDNSEDTSENSSEETKEKHDDSDEKEPECGFDQCHYFQENQLKEDIESCGGCAEWFDSKFDNEKDRHN